MPTVPEMLKVSKERWKKVAGIFVELQKQAQDVEAIAIAVYHDGRIHPAEKMVLLIMVGTQMERNSQKTQTARSRRKSLWK